MVCAGRRWAGKSSRCEDPAPTVGMAGMTPSDIYAHASINENGAEVDHDAARRVATSFKKRENRV